MRAPHTHRREGARLRVGLGAQASAPQHASTFRRRGLRGVRQVFLQASAFNANIGAWNTASLTGLTDVCAAFCRRRAPQRKRWSSMLRGAIDVAHTYIVVS